MVLCKLSELGILRLIVFFFDLVSNIMNLITSCMYSISMETPSLLLYM
jgi:hypothetical protein